MTTSSLLARGIFCQLKEMRYLSGVYTCQVRYKQKKPRYKSAPVAREQVKRVFAKKLLAPLALVEDTADEKYWEAEPSDNIWIRANYPTQKYSLHESIIRHQEYAQPDIFNRLDSILYADLSLNMATSKKTKFLKSVKETILLPHQFTFANTNKCIVFCQSEEDIQCALDIGAIYAGSDRLMRMLEDDTLTREDYDFVLATPDMVTKIQTLRSRLRDQYPSEKNGSMSADVAKMVTHFTNGITVESQNTTSESANRIQLPLGQLSMKTEQLAENFTFFIQTLRDNRSAKGSGTMILQAFLIAPPSPERFFLEPSAYDVRRSRTQVAEVEDDSEEALNISV